MQGTPNGMKAHVVLEEVGASYTVKTIDMGANEQKEPWYIKVNPNGMCLAEHCWLPRLPHSLLRNGC